MSACDELSIHPLRLTMCVARCPAGASDGPQRSTDSVYFKASAPTFRTCVSRAPTVSLGSVEARVSLDCKRTIVRPLVVRMLAPRAPFGPCATCGRLRATGSARIGVGGSE